MTPPYRIETERLVIRCYEPEDAALLKDAVDSSLDHLRPWMPWVRFEPQPLDQKIDLLRMFRGQFDQDDVIHKHDATRLHYDFRLEIGKVMPSWAIAKGPTLDPTKKRLAQMTNNHALEYRHFEGIIPKGGYGAGPVMIWDEGIYFPEVEVAKGVRDRIEDFQQAQRIMKEGLKKGELKFFLQGKKLQGSFALVKVSNFGEKSWLLIKHADNYVQKDYDANEYDFSATTHRSIKQILSGAEELQ